MIPCTHQVLQILWHIAGAAILYFCCLVKAFFWLGNNLLLSYDFYQCLRKKDTSLFPAMSMKLLWSCGVTGMLIQLKLAFCVHSVVQTFFRIR